MSSTAGRQGILWLGAWVLLVVAPLAFNISATSDQLGNGTPTGPSADAPVGIQAEIADLDYQRAHHDEGSAEYMKLTRKIERRRNFIAGRPRPEHPDLFAEILGKMRIPAGQEVSNYQPGYMQREFSRAKAASRKGAPLPWQSRGPGNVAGRARGLIIDPDSPGTWYVGSAGGGVWKTDDEGATWAVLTDDLPSMAMTAIAMAASNPDVMYAGTGESFFNIDTINGNGVWKSEDRGDSWVPLTATLGDPRFNNIARIVVSPDDPDVVVLAATTGRYKSVVNAASSIFKSTDGGTTWTEVFVETDVGSFGRVKKIQQIVATPGDFNTQYAAVDEKGILVSTDAGSSWAYSNSGITDFTGRFEIAVSPVDTDVVYAAAEGVDTAPDPDEAISNLWKSTDGGSTWIQTTQSGGGFGTNWLGGQGWYDNTIACHPTDVNTVFVGGVRLYRVTVSGSTRSTSFISSGPVHVDHHNLVVFFDGGNWRILNANDGGIGVSGFEDTGWSAPINGMLSTQFYGVDKRPGASAYIGGMQDNSTWRSPVDPSPTDPWTFQIGGDGYEASWHFDDPSKLIGGFQFNGLQRSLDGGQTWASATNGLGDTGGGVAPFLTKIAKTNADPELLFAVGASGVWRSTDFGGNWSLTAIPVADWANSGFSSFADVRISRANPDVVWAGMRMDVDGKIHVSTDGGLTFTATTNFAGMGGISGLATHPSDDQTAYVLFSFAEAPKILRTTDQGATWTDISGFAGGTTSTNGFPDVAVYDLLVFPDDPSKIWVGTEIGLVESLDGGASWALADNGLPNVGIWFLTHVEDEIVVATHGRGVWSVTIPSLINGEIYKPLVDKVYQSVDGLLTVEANLRSVYTSTDVLLNGAVVETLGANTFRQAVTLQYPVVTAGPMTVQLQGKQGGGSFDSVIKTVEAYVASPPQFAYSNNFDVASSDFTGNGFSIRSEPGFSTDALHSDHFYANGASLVHTLTQPIAVGPSNALLSFDEIVLVEPGNPGTVFGDGSFWDYVIVEGTSDGCVWVPLEDGYDARRFPEWESQYNSGGFPSDSLLRNHVINLQDTFSAGETILVRFRLYADGFVNGWGWVIDNLQIQADDPTAVDPAVVPSRFALRQNYPNPFNPKTTIDFSLPKASTVSLRVFDLRGRAVKTLLDESRPAGRHSIVWDGTDGAGQRVASGSYVYRIEAGEFRQDRKLTLIK